MWFLTLRQRGRRASRRETVELAMSWEAAGKLDLKARTAFIAIEAV